MDASAACQTAAQSMAASLIPLFPNLRSHKVFPNQPLRLSCFRRMQRLTALRDSPFDRVLCPGLHHRAFGGRAASTAGRSTRCRCSEAHQQSNGIGNSRFMDKTPQFIAGLLRRGLAKLCVLLLRSRFARLVTNWHMNRSPG